MPVPTQPQTPEEQVIRNDDDDDTIKVERDSSNDGDIHSPALNAHGREARHGGRRSGQPLPPPDFHSSTRDPKRPAEAKAAAKEGVVHEDATNTENDPQAVKVMKDEAKDHAAQSTPQPDGNGH